MLTVLYVLDAALGHPYRPITRLVNLGGEANLPTWFSSAQLLVLGLLLGVFAVLQAKRHAGRSWALFALPALCVLLSLDEVARIHEWLGNKSDVLLAGGTRKGSLVPYTGIWMFLLGPPFLLVVAILWRALSPYLKGRERIVRLYLVGFAVFTAAALGIELFANLVSPRSPAFVLQTVCEELGEMLGATILIWATLELLASYDIRVGENATPPRE